METMELDYKQDIIQTRTGNVGSSDARMLQQIAELGQVPKSAYKRMAVIKGLAENQDVTTPAMRFGDYIENQVFANLKASDERWQSNPCIKSTKYSRPNIGCLTHVDFMLQDDKNKVLTIGECKATKLSFEQARNEYICQIRHHYLLAQEYARSLGYYDVKILLCVYDANGVDYDEHEFNPSRLTVKQLRNMEKESCRYKLADAMDIVSSFLESFDSYYEGDEIDSVYLPEKVKHEFDAITNVLEEIKERKTKVEEFKARLFDFMSSHDIKSVKNDAWSITRVDPTESRQFDSKAFLADYATKHPRAYKKLVSGFEKVVERKGSVQIRLKDKKDNNE
jgi:hypothetical protein